MLIGQMLVKEGIITTTQLEEAINSQVVFGGRLGTNLIELGYIDEKTLNKFLGKKHKVLSADLDHLMKIDPSAIKCIPKPMVEKYKAIPAAREGKRLHVLMADPGNIKAVDELSFAIGYSITPVAIPEVRLLLLMEKYYGIKRDLRYISLSRADSEAFMRDLGREVPRPGGTTQAAVHPAKPEKVSGKKGGGDSHDLMPEEEFNKMIQRTPSTEEPEEVVDLTEESEAPEEIVSALGGSQSPEMPVSPPLDAPHGETPVQGGGPSPSSDEDLSSDLLQFFALPDEYQKALSIEEAVKHLEKAQNRDDIAKAVLHFCLGSFKRAALFVFKSDLIIGWDGLGKNFHQGLVKKVMLPLTEQSVFKAVLESQRPYRGEVMKTAVNERFLAVLGGAEPKEVCVVPIVLRGRVINAIYGDNGDKSGIDASIEDLVSLAQHIAPNFERIILDRRSLFEDS